MRFWSDDFPKFLPRLVIDFGEALIQQVSRSMVQELGGK